jgi:hypothetical protein
MNARSGKPPFLDGPRGADQKGDAKTQPGFLGAHTSSDQDERNVKDFS